MNNIYTPDSTDKSKCSLTYTQQHYTDFWPFSPSVFLSYVDNFNLRQIFRATCLILSAGGTWICKQSRVNLKIVSLLFYNQVFTRISTGCRNLLVIWLFIFGLVIFLFRLLTVFWNGYLYRIPMNCLTVSIVKSLFSTTYFVIRLRICCVSDF